ncbi:MAG: OFA family MFS transporter [Fibrobacterota bacterium]
MDNPEIRIPEGHRWRIAIMGTLLQLCLGTVYAWSYFQKPLMTAYGWNNAQVAWVFSLAICFLGLSAAWGGVQLPRRGPRMLAMTGGLLFGIGYLLGALALHLHSLPLLYLGYGVIGGCGLGLGYVTPVATAAQWFPDKKGLVTGMVIMGFGLGALLMSKVFAPFLLRTFDGNLVKVFAWLGVIFLVLTLRVASFLKNPLAVTSVSGVPVTPDSAPRPVREALLSRRFLMMWVVFFCNIVAGISIISFQSPLLQDIYRKVNPALDPKTLAAFGATLIGVSSLFNGLGRFFWGGLSDKIGRAQVFRIMLGSEILVFVALLFTQSPLLFSVLVCYILLCYGGGFGTMPSFVLDAFGPKLMAVVYGTILTAWSAAGIAGPQMVAFIKDRMGDAASGVAFGAAAGFLALGFLLSLFLDNRRA